MSQQINLYQPIFRKEQIVFSARTIVWLSAGLLALLLLWSFLVSQRVGRLEAEHQRQLQAEERAVSQLTRLQREAGPTEPSPELEARVARLEQRRETLEQSLQALTRQVPASQSRLGERIDAIARQLPEGMWLSRIELASEGREVTLHGRALAPRLVPDYLRRLGDEQQFAGTGFRQVRLDAMDNGQAGVRFVVSTREDDT